MKNVSGPRAKRDLKDRQDCDRDQQEHGQFDQAIERTVVIEVAQLLAPGLEGDQKDFEDEGYAESSSELIVVLGGLQVGVCPEA